MSGRELYPEIEPYRTGRLRLDPVHEMHWEECGNPVGQPVLFLHGGPGAGCWPVHRRFFDPAHYRVVLFDQRGAGRSPPLGELADNTTVNLIGDIERLRAHLEIDRWLVFGGSWGSTLALAYAQAYPTRSTGLVLRGIFLGGTDEIDWFVHGMRRVFPEAWQRFADAVPAPGEDGLLATYHRHLTDPDPEVHWPAALAWSRYEGACSTLLPDPAADKVFSDDVVALGISRVEAHYFVNNCFLDEGALLAGIDRIRDIPSVIVQGRYDMVCPIVTADALARAWPEARYVIVPDAGHSAGEPGIRTALLDATDGFRERT